MKLQQKAVYILLLLASLSVNAADIQHWRTDKGARVYFIPNHSLAMLDVRVVFNAGSARDRLSGVAALSNGLLDTGAGSGAGALDANGIAEALEDVGAQMSNAALRDMAVVSLRSLSDEQRLQPALDVLTTVLSEPSYPKADFVREKQRLLLLGLKSQQQQPAAVAKRAFFKALYGEHPYADMPAGSEDSVAQIQRIHLRRFHRRYYVARNAVIALVGDVSRARAAQIAEQISAALPEGEAAPALPSLSALSAAQRMDVPMQTQQSHILIGQPGLKRGEPDYYDLYVGNHILGGSGFASQLMQSIREERGLAYSVYSYFSPMQELGPFTMGMQTKNAQREQAIALLMENLRQFIANGPTEEQLDKALKNITGSAPLRTDSNKKLVEYLAMIGFYQLPLDYLERFNEQVSAVTVESIKAAWQQRIHPDKLVTVVVGGAPPAEPTAAPQ
ncbi:MAG: peptidase M16 [Gammaproteobacteria bacterium]|nr:MAG: peptidase M16 [Gammaproteobacteria bacterium]